MKDEKEKMLEITLKYGNKFSGFRVTEGMIKLVPYTDDLIIQRFKECLNDIGVNHEN